mgnify:CR=1 FL=1
MKIDLNRLATLAGIDNKSESMLSEGSDHDANEMMHSMEEEKYDETMHSSMEGMHEDDMEEGLYEEDLDEEIEIDEVMLVQELRRAKQIMSESKRQNAKKQRLQESRRKRLQEAELKMIIEDEVQNVMKELNLTSSWVYGGNKPKRSREGYTHQGSYLKGLGFK